MLTGLLNVLFTTLDNFNHPEINKSFSSWTIHGIHQKNNFWNIKYETVYINNKFVLSNLSSYDTTSTYSSMYLDRNWYIFRGNAIVNDPRNYIHMLFTFFYSFNDPICYITIKLSWKKHRSFQIIEFKINIHQ